MVGWIKLHRGIKDHWIFSDAEKLKAWIIIILEVNFEDKTELINGELIKCKRGQSLYSLGTWANKFGTNWTMRKVRTFFDLLKKDGMIDTEGLRKTTRLTVCNYESYQNERQANDTQKSIEQSKRRQRDVKETSTTKEGKEVQEGKEVKKEEIKDLWNNKCSPPLSEVKALSKSRKDKLKIRINEIGGIEEFSKLFDKVVNTPFLIGQNDRGWKANFDWIIENDKNWLKVMEGNYESKVTGKPDSKESVKQALLQTSYNPRG